MTETLPIPVLRTVSEVREFTNAVRTRGERVSLVPTMGALHDGHLSLVRSASKESECVVLSLFVNPTQFNVQSDLDAYPRTEASDVKSAASAGCTVVFAPSVLEIYPTGFDSSITVGGVALPLEGETRGATHFRGVATVVAKLFNIVAPDVAWFGQKDAQQVMVVKQMVRDLNFAVEIRVGETVREADGLALSSRNVRLTAHAREQALGIIEALRAVKAAVAHGERSAAALREIAYVALRARGITSDNVDYIAIANTNNLEQYENVSGEILVAIAAHVGGVRLIDNMTIVP